MLYFFLLLSTLLFRFNSELVILTRLIDLLVALLVLSLLFFRRKIVIYKPALFVLVAVVIGMIMSLTYGAVYRDLYSGNSISTYFEFFRPFLFFLIFSYFYTNCKSRFNSMISAVFIFYLLIQAMLMIFQKFIPEVFRDSSISYLYDMSKISISLGRVVGISANPNTLAIAISMAFFFLVYRALRVHLYAQAFLIILLNISLVYMTTSRMVTISLVMVYLLSIFLVFPKKYSVVVLLIGLFGLPVLINIGVSNPYFNQLLVKLFDFNFMAIPSVYNRLENYSIMLELMKDDYLFSGGPLKDLVRVGDNVYLFILFQWGIVGLILQLLPFICLMFVSLVNIKNVASASLVFMGSLLLILCGLSYETFYNLFYMPIFLLFCAIFLKEKSLERTPYS